MFLYYYLQWTDRKVVVPMEQKLETFYTLRNDETKQWRNYAKWAEEQSSNCATAGDWERQNWKLTAFQICKWGPKSGN